MELRLQGRTVVVLGPGEDLDRVLIRELNEAGAATFATQLDSSWVDLTDPDASTPQWVSREGHIDAAAARRAVRFLSDYGRSPDAVVIHLNLFEELKQRGPVRWWRRRAQFRSIMRTASEIALALVTDSEVRRLVLLHHLTETDERSAALRWMRRASSAVVRRAGGSVRVNSVLVGVDSDLAEVASLTAVLCSPLAARVSGALLPIDDGLYAQALALKEEDEDDD